MRKCSPYDARERIVWTDVLSLVNYSGAVFPSIFSLRVVSFYLQRTYEGRLKIMDGSAYIQGLYIMRRTRLSLTSRTSQFLHYVFKQLYDVSVQGKKTN